MDLHKIKLQSKYYPAVIFGNKTFEIRKFDRDYKVGDLINFIVQNEEGDYEELSTVYKITYILSECEEYGLMKGYCILGIKEIK